MQQLTVVFSSGQSRNSRVILISRKSVRAVHYGTQLVVASSDEWFEYENEEEEDPQAAKTT